MDCINFNKILDRENIAENISNILRNFEENKKNLLEKRGIYIYGESGIGKTTFVNNILKKMNYDIIYYDAGDIRNKNVIETITKNNISDKSVLSLFKKKKQSIAIIMDEIDGMNNGDKGGINALIKLIRPKKTKKQKIENITHVPIICISNYHIDKKIKELIKVCIPIELKKPTDNQIKDLIKLTIPSVEKNLIDDIVLYINNDLRKMKTINDINNNNILTSNIINNILVSNSFQDDTKKITNLIIENKYGINEHSLILNDTDRTIVGLLWHENIIDKFDNNDTKVTLPVYHKILENISFSDYIDRITFQKQIWQLNEMSSIIKTFKSNFIYHSFDINNNNKINNIRFTKVLTKYSTEYNNIIFIQDICNALGFDKNDTYSYFIDYIINYSDAKKQTLELNNFTNLEITRICNYLQSFM
jgi:SpoVK/Ycf46/Vps4 family AAA+-type ATPase